MKHILVVADPYNDEQVAFQKALKLAKSTIADINVISFCYDPLSDVQYDYPPSKTDTKAGVAADINLKQLVMREVQQQWNDYIATQECTEQVSHEVVWAKYIHLWLIEHCKTHHYDLIVKTGRRSESFFYTPTDWQLFRESQVPIYCISKPDYQAKKVVLVALDLKAKSKEKQLLNQRLLESAFQLAVQTDAVLHCCYAIVIPTLVKDLDMIDVTAKVHEVENEVRQQARSWFEVYDIDSKYLHIKEGKPWQVVNDCAAKLKAQCIVVGSMGRTGIVGKLIGNTAEKVINHARSDLLVI